MHKVFTDLNNSTEKHGYHLTAWQNNPIKRANNGCVSNKVQMKLVVGYAANWKLNQNKDKQLWNMLKGTQSRDIEHYEIC